LIGKNVWCKAVWGVKVCAACLDLYCAAVYATMHVCCKNSVCSNLVNGVPWNLIAIAPQKVNRVIAVVFWIVEFWFYIQTIFTKQYWRFVREARSAYPMGV